MTVLVVGGGITGLTTAYMLAQSGIPTTLVEASDRLGGKIRTDSVNGFLIESGPDSFVSYRLAALELVRELGLGDAIIAPTNPRTVWIRARGRLVRMPEGMGLVLPTRLAPFVRTDMFSPLEKLRIGLDLFQPRDGTGDDVSVGAFLRRRLGGALVERLAGPLWFPNYARQSDSTAAFSWRVLLPGVERRCAEAARRSSAWPAAWASSRMPSSGRSRDPAGSTFA
jgi:oxygen-dependent protoporphyrinogen oxidase